MWNGSENNAYISTQMEYQLFRRYAWNGYGDIFIEHKVNISNNIGQMFAIRKKNTSNIVWNIENNTMGTDL